MFNQRRAKTQNSSIKPLKDLILIEIPEVAIKNSKHNKLISHIKSSSGFKNAEFDLIVMPLILKTFKYCQKLPESSVYYAQLGGLIDLSLNRAEAAVNLMRHVLAIEDNKAPSEEQKLWLYALFSAAMLQGMGKLYTDYKVNIFDKNGHYIKCWAPLLESLVSVGDYYDYDLLKGDDFSFKNSITPLIARRIMPTAGFEKIISNPEVFAIWLAMLREDKEAAGPLAAILDRANAIAMQRYINNFLKKFGDFDNRANRLGTFVDPNIDSNINKEQVIGAEFLAWLTASLETGKIILNQQPFLVEVRDGELILHPSTFEFFMEEHKKFKNKVAMQKSFLTWNMHRLTDADKQQFSQVESRKGDPGISLNTAILPEKVKIYDAKTNKISSTSSLNLILNLQGYSQTSLAALGLMLNKLSRTEKLVSGEEDVTRLQNPKTRGG